MALSPRTGTALVGFGALLVPLSFAFSGSTAMLCTDVDGVAYDAIGIHLSRLHVTAIDVFGLVFYWSDGCNVHVSSLIPVLLGVWLVGFGLVVRGGGTAGFADSGR